MSVRMTSEDENETAIIFSVKDTGIGIAVENQENIFYMFTQEDSSTTRKYGGTGLGLAIAKQLVNLMGGEIGVISEKNKGSEFWFVLRLFKQSALLRKNKSITTFSGLHLLVADNNAMNREFIITYLESWGIETEIAQDGPSALSMLYHARNLGKPFAGAIIEMQMPDMNGIVLAQAIKADNTLKDTRLILMSSAHKQGNTKQTHQIGFAAYLFKPVQKSDLYTCLSAAFTELSDSLTSHKNIPEFIIPKRTNGKNTNKKSTAT